jgi:hypothetical protein
VEAVSGALIEWSVAGRSARADGESGDQYLVKNFEGGALVAVVDGLGHGPGAAEAARAAVAVLDAHAGEPPSRLLRRCHETLRGTRGAVLSLAAFNSGTMAWVGVGNVDGVLVRAQPGGGPAERLLVRSGLVGHHLPALEPSRLAVWCGDTLILATDGVDSGFDRALRPGRVDATAERILAGYAKATDDALVVVARYVGADP